MTTLGYQTFSVFLGFNRASERAGNRFYPDGYKVRNRLYNEYLGNRSDEIHESAKQAAFDEALRRQEQFNLSRAERKKRERANNLKKSQQTFGSLSKSPSGGQDGYIQAKQLSNIISPLISNGLIRFGSDNWHGEYTALGLYETTSLATPDLKDTNDKLVFAGIEFLSNSSAPIVKRQGRNKDFSKGANKSGACHPIGFEGLTSSYAGTIAICEGAADGYLIHHYWKSPVAVALDAGNILKVARDLKSIFPKTKIVIVNDNDRKYANKDNGGVLAGMIASYELGCYFVTPDFSAFDDDSEAKDVHDLWLLAGGEAIIRLRDIVESVDSDTDIDALKLNYLGKPNFFKAVNEHVKSIYRPGNDEAFIQKLLKFAEPHLERLELTDNTFLEEIGINSLIKSLQKTFRNRALARHLNRQAFRLTQYIGRVHSDDKRDYPVADFDQLETNTLGLIGGMGTGKTEAIKRLAFSDPECRVLVISSRKALARGLAKRFGAVYYEDYKKMSFSERQKVRKIVAVSNSLDLMSLTGDEVFDYVIFDECDDNLFHLFSGTFNDSERETTLTIIRGLVKNARRVIFAQAHIVLMPRFLAQCGRDDIQFVVNSYKRYKGLPVTIYGSDQGLVSKLHEFAERRERTIVSCNTKERAQSLYEGLVKRFHDLKIGIITSATCYSDEAKIILAVINSGKTPDVDILIHSPYIGNGVSIDDLGFEHAVSFIKARKFGLGAPDASAQMMFRARLMKNLHVYIEPCINTPISTDPVFFLNKAIEGYLSAQITWSELSTGQPILTQPDSITYPSDDDELRARIKAFSEDVLTDFLKEIYAILCDMGCDVRFEDKASIPDKAKEDGSVTLIQGRKISSEKFVASVKSAKVITPDEYKAKKRRPESPDDPIEVARYEIEQDAAIGLKTLPESKQDEIIKVFAEGKGRRKMAQAAVGLLTEDEAKEVIAYNLQNKSPYSFKHFFGITWRIKRAALEMLGIQRVDNQIKHLWWEDGTFFIWDDLRQTEFYKLLCDNRDLITGTEWFGTIADKHPTEVETLVILKKVIKISEATGRRDELIKFEAGISDSYTGIDTQQVAQKIPLYIKDVKERVKSVPLVETDGGDANYGVTQFRRYKINVKGLRITEPDNPIASHVFSEFTAFLHIEKTDDGYGGDDSFEFTFDEWRKTPVFAWIAEHKDEINATGGLGLKIPKNKDMPSDRVLHSWLKGFGISLVAKRARKRDPLTAVKANKDETIRLYRPVFEEIIWDSLERHLQAGTLQYQPLVTRERDRRMGMPLKSVQLYQPEITHGTARRYIRHSIIEALGLRRNDKLKCFERVDDKWVELSDLVGMPWFNWALAHIDVVNEASLGAKIKAADAPMKNLIATLSSWVRAMKIDLKSKNVRASQLVDLKRVDFKGIENTGNAPTPNDKSADSEGWGHPNKDVGGENKPQQKQRRVKLHQASDKTLHRAWEIFDADMPDKSDDDGPAENEIVDCMLAMANENGGVVSLWGVAFRLDVTVTKVKRCIALIEGECPAIEYRNHIEHLVLY
ncbi:MAG: hypothetical protein ABFS56_23910 [Pseudomonadota bacterium]